MTIVDLAKATRFSITRIEAIESGQEVWLSVTDRSVLARGLGVQPEVLKEVEFCPSDLRQSSFEIPVNDYDELAERILAGELNIECPKCGKLLKTAIENALDFEGQATQYARAYCPVCPFALR